jgi:hypothetical protein
VFLVHFNGTTWLAVEAPHPREVITVLAKIFTSAMVCAACLAAATLPAVEKAGLDLARTAEVNLAVDFTSLAGLNAITTFFGTNGVFTGGGVNALANYAALSAIPVFIGTNPVTGAGTGVFNGGGVDALAGYDALSAIPVFVGTNGVFTGGGVNALAGYDALSAIPVFIGTDPGTGAGTGVFNGGGVNALAGYDALSAIPALLANPRTVVPTPTVAAARIAAPEQQIQAPSGSGNPVLSAVQGVSAALPKLQAQPAPEAVPQVDPTATTPDNSGAATQNITRNSKKYTPESIGNSPILFGTGTPGVNNGISGWGEGLKKLGIGGAPSGAAK